MSLLAPFLRLPSLRLSVALLLSCLWFCPPAQAAKPLVVASIQPLALLAQEFYGDKVEVRTLLLPSQNPHQVSFTPQQLRLLHDADEVIWLGAAAEPYLTPYLERRPSGALALLDQPGVTALADEDDHHTQVDPHLWLAPDLLAKLLPALAATAASLHLPQAPLTTRAQKLQQQWQAMQQQAKQQLQPLAHTPWLTYHNPWHYLQQALGLAAPLQVEEQLGTELGSRHFLHLAQSMHTQEVRCALLEPEARLALMEKLCRSPECKLVPLDPLARDSQAGSYSQWWQALAGKVKQCLAP